MEHQEGNDNEAEDEHVLRRPLNLGGTRGHGVTLVAAGTAVLHGEPEGVEDVDDEAGGEHERAYEGVPVGSEELADYVVGCGPEDGYAVHQRMERHE